MSSPLMNYYGGGGDDLIDSLIPEFDEFGRRLPKRKPSLADLMPEEERKSLLAQAAGASASGLAGLGWILDTPGAAVRGLLSGGPSKALSSLWETADERVDGRELLQQYGLASNNKNYANFFGGMAAEMLLDPLTYINPLAILGNGALRPAGEVAKRAGMLDNLALTARKEGMGHREFLMSRTPQEMLDRASSEAADLAAAKYSKAVEGYGKSIASDPRQQSLLQDLDIEDAFRSLPVEKLPDDLVRRAFPTRKAVAIDKGIPEADILRWTPEQFIDDARQAPLVNFQRAAQAAGLNPEDLMNSPLSSLMEARIPGTGMAVGIGQGDRSKAIARGLDRFGEALTTNPITAPVATRAVAAFDRSVLDQVDRADQWAAREAWAAQNANRADARMELTAELLAPTRVTRELGGKAVGFTDPRIQNAIADSLEAGLDPEKMALLRDKEALDLIARTPEWDAFRKWAHHRNQDSLLNRRENGLTAGEWVSDEGTSFLGSQVYRFPMEQAPVVGGHSARRKVPYERGQRLYNTDDLVGMGRNPYLDLPRRRETVRALSTDAELLESLRAAGDDVAPELIDSAMEKLGLGAPYRNVRGDLGSLNELEDAVTVDLRRRLHPADKKIKPEHIFPQPREVDPKRILASDAAYEKAIKTLTDDATRKKRSLADLLRQSDLQHPGTRKLGDDRGAIGLFDNAVISDMNRSLQGEAVSLANADMLKRRLKESVIRDGLGQAGGGYVSMDDALAQLGFNPKAAGAELFPDNNLKDLAIAERELKALKALGPRGPEERGLIGDLYKSFTGAFKAMALATPAYHMRNLQSGGLSTMMNDAAPLRSVPGRIADFFSGWRGGKGNDPSLVTNMIGGGDDWIYSRIKDIPGFEGLSKQAAIDRFNLGAGRHDLGQGQILEGAASPNFVVGQGERGKKVRDLLWNKDRSWYDAISDFFTVRGVDFKGAFTGRQAPTETLNPWVKLNENWGKSTEDALRLGTYIGELRRGATPDVAAAKVFRTQVDYSPDAFTSFERKLKQIIPFYSYPRGILPSVLENILERPGGLQGRTIRAVSNASRPNEDSFLPEHLRKSAAIQLPFGASGDSNLASVLSLGILPYEGLVNLVSPGQGSTVYEKITDSLQKTGLNLAGMVNPVFKAPAEMLLDRQLYSGREMSDLYSFFEDKVGLGTPGRHAEQLVSNFLPGGGQAIGIARTLGDERLSAAEKAIKLLTNKVLGVKLSTIDQQKARDKATRDTLQDLLRTTPGVQRYESLNVPEEALASMSEEQRRQYLLYRIMQSEASKRARERKNEARDPLEIILGKALLTA